ncbi:MAG: zf-HC2 domain-containing protein [Acidobacteria bacterium]|nr:zf-HC2 domain-containing protein [Acidobacteriota bacterium]
MAGSMNCEQIESRLMDYMEGALREQDHQTVQAHLHSCSSCAQRVEGFMDVFNVLDSWKGIEPSPSFNAGLRQRIEQESASAGWWGTVFARLIPLPAGNPVFALALLLIVSVAAVVVRYSPAPPATTLARQQPTLVANAAGVDDIALYRNLPVLEDLDVLRNFEVLQDLSDANN